MKERRATTKIVLVFSGMNRMNKNKKKLEVGEGPLFVCVDLSVMHASGQLRDNEPDGRIPIVIKSSESEWTVG